MVGRRRGVRRLDAAGAAPLELCARPRWAEQTFVAAKDILWMVVRPEHAGAK